MLIERERGKLFFPFTPKGYRIAKPARGSEAIKNTAVEFTPRLKSP